MKKSGFYPVIDIVGYGNADTLRTLVFYYLFNQQPKFHAADWCELNYTKILFPKAAVSFQRIRESLAEIGTEDSMRMFFAAYYAFLKNRAKLARKRIKAGKADLIAGSDEIDCGDSGILIDRTGLPNSSQISFTAISNHNGTVREEARLIYVVQQGTGFPCSSAILPETWWMYPR